MRELQLMLILFLLTIDLSKLLIYWRLRCLFLVSRRLNLRLLLVGLCVTGLIRLLAFIIFGLFSGLLLLHLLTLFLLKELTLPRLDAFNVLFTLRDLIGFTLYIWIILLSVLSCCDLVLFSFLLLLHFLKLSFVYWFPSPSHDSQVPIFGYHTDLPLELVQKFRQSFLTVLIYFNFCPTLIRPLWCRFLQVELRRMRGCGCGRCLGDGV